MTSSEDELRAKVAGIVQIPREVRLDSEDLELMEFRRLLHRRMFGIVDNAERWDRDLTPEEDEEHRSLKAEYDALADEMPIVTQTHKEEARHEA